MPLEWRGGAFCFRYRVGSSIEAARGDPGTTAGTFWGVADTGSPFMLLSKCLRRDCPSYCERWGCFSSEGRPSGLPDTLEGYASGLNEVQWREGASLAFPDAVPTGGAQAEPVVLSNLSFGVQGRVIGNGGTGDGVFFGLVRDRMDDIRTSFMEQTPFRSLCIDLRSPGREMLTLSDAGLQSLGVEGIPLVDPRQWGDPVRHYSAIATRFRVGGMELAADSSRGPRKVLCIFDTGTTGISMTPGLHDAYFETAAKVAQAGAGRVPFSEARRLELDFELPGGGEKTLEMYRGRHPVYGNGLDIVTPVDEVAWAGIGPPASLANYKVPGGVASKERPFTDVALVGLGFLVGRQIEIDAERSTMRFSPRQVSV